ncbi:MAG: GPW/gp25 family protein [Acidobacteriota bacterium]
MIDFARFGSDLRLLENLGYQEQRDRGADLMTRVRPESGRTDLDRLAGVENLKQALLLRFLTPVGELAALGHRDYGSRLHTLIGERNDETNRNRAKLYVLEALAAEPRVQEVLDVQVLTRRSEPTRLDIHVTAKVVDHDTPLNLVFPFFLERVAAP